MLRVHGGYHGWTDQQILAMPYARLIQATRVATHFYERAAKDALINSAFVGYQFAASQGALKPSTTFEKYLAGMGLADKPKGSTLRSEKERAKETAARVAELFNQGPVRKELVE